MLRFAASALNANTRFLKKNVSSTVCISSCNLFSAAGFHKIPNLEERIKNQKESVKDITQYKLKITEEFTKHGLKHVFNDEIEKAILFSEDKKDLDIANNLLVALFEDDLRCDFAANSDILLLFFQKCYQLNCVQSAMNCWNNPVIKESKIIGSRRSICRIYYDFLFINGAYEEILNDVNINKEILKQFQEPQLFASYSCYKIGTREALKICVKEILPLIPKTFIGESMAERATALLAYNVNELAVADGLVRKHNMKRRRKWPLFYNNLELLILLKAGRLEEAVTFSRAFFSPKPHLQRPRRVVLSPVVEELVKTVTESGDTELVPLVMEIVEGLERDDAVTVWSHTLEDLMMMPIKSKFHEEDVKYPRDVSREEENEI